MLTSIVIMAASLGLDSISSVVAATVCTALGGLTSGVGITVGFAAAKDLNRASKEYDSLSVAWVNSISLFGAFVPPVVFSHVVTWFGYPVAWVTGAATVLLFAVPLLFLKE
jgi:hypothetical protein